MQALFKFHQFTTNVFFMFQDPTQNSTLHLVIMSS